MEGEFDVVALPGKGGKDPADYAGVDVAGKVVLTNAAPSRVAELAIREHGAAGILFDGMAAGGRTELDLPDARQYTSFWFAGEVQPFGWGFVLSPRQGRALRASLAAGKPVRVQASIRSRFYPGTFEVVEAFIPGTSGANEILMVSHLCHPRPGANDNASGAAALLETAATLARLIGQGELPAPRHGIRFIWVPEMTGTFAWLAAQEAEVRSGRWLAGLNLDMVGADQCLTNGVCEFVSLPAAGAAFADHLLNWLRRAVQRRHPVQGSAFRQRLGSLHPQRPQRRHPDADDQRLAGQVLPHLGRHARQGRALPPWRAAARWPRFTRTGWRPPARPTPPGSAT